jgi:hypothetical protein
VLRPAAEGIARDPADDELAVASEAVGAVARDEVASPPARDAVGSSAGDRDSVVAGPRCDAVGSRRPPQQVGALRPDDRGSAGRACKQNGCETG